MKQVLNAREEGCSRKLKGRQLVYIGKEVQRESSCYSALV